VNIKTKTLIRISKYAIYGSVSAAGIHLLVLFVWPNPIVRWAMMGIMLLVILVCSVNLLICTARCHKLMAERGWEMNNES